MVSLGDDANQVNAANRNIGDDLIPFARLTIESPDLSHSDELGLLAPNWW